MARNFIGNLLRMERIRQGKGQKEICYGICVTSYLCKIEKGQVSPDKEIVKKLFSELGIVYYEDEALIEESRKLIEIYYDQVNYGLERTAFGRLKELEHKLMYSEVGLDYRLICCMEEAKGYEIIESCKDSMTDRQLGLFYLLTPRDKSWEEILEAYEKAYKLLDKSGVYFNVFNPLFQLERYAEIHRRMQICRELALEEGNTYVLAATFFAQGHVYAVLDLDELMMEYYERGLKLLQNTSWIHSKEIEGIYYNMGAVFVNTKHYKKALEHLDKIKEETFMLWQKKALVYIRTNHFKEAQKYLQKMKTYIEQQSDKDADRELYKLIYDEAVMEQEEDYLKDPLYLELLEQLQKVIKRDKHFGYLYFYREQIIEAYSSQKKYKKALAFQKEISSKTVIM